MANMVMTQRGTGNYLLSYIKQRIERNKNFLAAITGPTGSGKSYSALFIAEQLDPDFSITQVAFTPSEFMTIINSPILKKGSVVVFDEAGVGLASAEWQSIENKLMNYVLQTFRHRNFIVFFTSPHLAFISLSSRKLLHCHMETIGIDTKEKKVRLKPLMIQVSQRSGDMYFKYLRVIIPGRGVVPFVRYSASLPSKELLRAYEEKKTAFTGRLNKQIATDLAEREQVKRREITDRQREVLELLKQKKTMPEICEQLNLRGQDTARAHMKAMVRLGYKFKPVKERQRVLYYVVEEPS